MLQNEVFLYLLVECDQLPPGGGGGVNAISQGQVCVNSGFDSDFYNLSNFGYPIHIIQ